MDPDREHDDSPPAPRPESDPEPAALSTPSAPPAAVDESPVTCGTRDSSEPDAADTLSPAVRRLVRQYDLDITRIHGTGPAGKIRVGDVIGMLGARAESSPQERAAVPAAPVGDFSNDDPPPLLSRAVADDVPDADTRTGAPDASEPAVRAARAAPAPSTTVFECDLSNVLSHRKRERRADAELLLTSYFVAACSDALRDVPEVAAHVAQAGLRPPRGADPAMAPTLGVLLATAEGGLRRTLVAISEPGLDGRLRAIDGQLRASGDDDLHPARLLIHHYGPSGSLFATPTGLGAGHTASVGIGRVRREFVIRTLDGEEAPRVAALCYVTLTFLPEHVALERANRFVAELVRVLEHWTPANST